MSDQQGEGGFAPRRRRRESSPLPMPQVADRLPPHSIESEQGILGCIMLDPKLCLPIAIEKIKAGSEVFYDLRHDAIYSALVEMFESDIPIDPITFQQKLSAQNQFEALGGGPYIFGLMNCVPSASNLEYYIDIVVEKHQLRKVIQACTSAVAKIYEGCGEVGKLVDEIGGEVMRACESGKVKESKTIKELVHTAIATIEDIDSRKGEPQGLPTGFHDLDKMTGGLRDTDLIVIAARPSLGKTSIAMNIAEHVAIECKQPVGIFSLEMTAEALVLRMVCSRARVNLRNIQDGFLAERDYPKLTMAAGKLANAPIHIDDTNGMTILQLKAKARRMFQQYGVKLFVIDYLQLVTHVGRMENRAQQIGQVCQGMKDLAKELGVPVIVLAQLNRELDKMEKKNQRKPRLSDLRESGDIEQIADLIGMLYKAESTDDSEDGPRDIEAIPVNLLIAKQRNGPTGDVNLTFLKSYTRYESAAKVSDVPTAETESRLFESQGEFPS